jgi:hypothetical protein
MPLTIDESDDVQAEADQAAARTSKDNDDTDDSDDVVSTQPFGPGALTLFAGRRVTHPDR